MHSSTDEAVFRLLFPIITLNKEYLLLVLTSSI